jgi:8-oxo-dGTP pyrophosphatase MutT (NUDIX family)
MGKLAESCVLEWTENRFGGVVVDPEALPAEAEEFKRRLPGSLSVWAEQGLKVTWLEIPISKTPLIPVAVEAGFVFHHSGQHYVMMTRQLVEDAFVPPYATHYIGAGGVVLNDRQELLVVWEKAHRQRGAKYYKLPGGALHAGEHIVDCVQREVHEETGIETRFESLVCFRHWHGYRFKKSDIYFVCRLSPLNHEIAADEEEIAECLWMPVQEYLASEDVGVFNKRIVQAALNGASLVPTWIEGYQSDPDRREIFMPAQA